MEVEVNIWGVLGAFVASMVVGSIWYAKPVFGRTWMKLVGLSDKQMKAGGFKPFVKMVPAALLQAFVLAHATFLSAYFFTDSSWMESALSTAFWMWAGFQLTAFMTHDAFEQRPTKLTVINAGNQLFTLLAMGLVIGWLK
ncbi:MAG: DUF1761 domain-containing protein [Patescibacteria group bacterium]